MKPCTLGKRHKWTFVRNVVNGSAGNGWVRMTKRGLYRCACGQSKYGEPSLNLKGVDHEPQ